MILIDGLAESAIPADDRGFAYDDGVFRTLAMRKGRPGFWTRHYARLAADCRALAIAPPSAEVLLADLRIVAARLPESAIRITVTRGSGGRGYAAEPTLQPRRVVAAGPLPDYPDHYRTHGVRVRYCDLRLAAQPRLAGVKHLNRLENVLARAEWHDPAIAEGLLLDAENHVIEGTRSNLFIVEGNTLITPDLSRCGVAGVTRDLVMEAAQRHGMSCQVQTVDRQRLESADEVFLVNSLIGVWPVAAAGSRKWSRHTVTPLVGKWLDAADR